VWAITPATLEGIGRRKNPAPHFLKAAGAAGATGAAMATGLVACGPDTATTAAAAPAAEPEVWLTLNATEAAFTKAAVDTLIPADELTPSGTDVGLASFIDRQLAGGSAMVRGSIGKGRSFRQARARLSAGAHAARVLPRRRRATNEWTKKTYGKEFDRLTPEQREETLKALEEGSRIRRFSSALFFDSLLTLTQEGFFADPMYGGNKNKVAWKMIGFPVCRELSRRDQDLLQQEIRQGTAIDCGLLVRGGRWSRNSKRSMRSSSAWAGRKHPIARADQSGAQCGGLERGAMRTPREDFAIPASATS